MSDIGGTILGFQQGLKLCIGLWRKLANSNPVRDSKMLEAIIGFSHNTNLCVALALCHSNYSLEG